MKYLLDTNAFILLNLDFGALPLTYRRIFADGENTFVLSPATIWEMAIKVRLGKLNLSGISLDTLTGQLRRKLKIELLTIKQNQLLAIARLPKVPSHGDPFDLLIIAQALTENLPVLTSDGQFHHYGVDVVR